MPKEKRAEVSVRIDGDHHFSYEKSDEKRCDTPTDRCATEPRNGAVGEPVAWSVEIEGSTVFSAWIDEVDATRDWKRLKKLYEGTRHGRIVVVPLFRSPTLTDAEHEAIRWVVGDVADITGPVEETLRGLLERLGG